MNEELLNRIAQALERLAPVPLPQTDWYAFPAYIWDGKAARGVERLDAPALELMQGIDKQKVAVVDGECA